eukprot:9048310-Alexandrium_andersonii.AAC.1
MHHSTATLPDAANVHRSVVADGPGLQRSPAAGRGGQKAATRSASLSMRRCSARKTSSGPFDR